MKEVAKVRNRVISYCVGRGLDLGCGPEKICYDAIGIDSGRDYGGETQPGLRLDLSAPRSLGMFANCCMDYVFSSHLLEDLLDTKGALSEWWRVVKPGGHLILYGPDPDYYPRVGQVGANPRHKRDLYWEDVWEILESFGNAELIQSSRHNDNGEYSWQLVAQKSVGIGTPETTEDDRLFRPMVFPRKKVTDKECLVIRYGALGDAVWITPALKKLKEDGYYVVLNCTEYSAQVLIDCPWIDEFMIQGKDKIPNAELGTYWDEIGKSFEKVINWSGTIEGTLLIPPHDPKFNLPAKKLHRLCDVNYMDQTMKVAGYPELKGCLPELHFNGQEEFLAKFFTEKLKDMFVVMWSLSGSSIHKAYPWAEYVAGEIQKNHRDVQIFTVGDDMCKILEWNLPNTSPRCGRFTVRQSMLLTKYVNLVIGPETGVLNAASCYDTPKVVLLSHSSENNLTKYWKNCTALHPENCSCHPCHKLHYTFDCPEGKHGFPKCAENIAPETVYNAFLKYYNRWKQDHEFVQLTNAR